MFGLIDAVKYLIWLGINTLKHILRFNLTLFWFRNWFIFDGIFDRFKMFPTLKHTIITLGFLYLLIVNLSYTFELKRIGLVEIKMRNLFSSYFFLFLFSFAVIFELTEIFFTKLFDSLLKVFLVRINCVFYPFYQRVDGFISDKNCILSVVQHQKQFRGLLKIICCFKILQNKEKRLIDNIFSKFNSIFKARDNFDEKSIPMYI